MLEELAFMFCCVPELQSFILNVCLCCCQPSPSVPVPGTEPIINPNEIE